MKDGPLGPGELLLARVQAPPVHELEPAVRPQPRRWTKAVLAAGLRPASILARALLGPARRNSMLQGARVRSLVFIKLDHLGDVIMATPILRALHAWVPEARITMVVRPATADLAARLPGVAEVLTADVPWIRPGSGVSANLGACLALARTLRARRFDLAVDLRYHNRLDSLLLSLSGARARLGFDAGGFGFGISHCARWPREGHEAGRMAGALREFGVPVEDLAPEFPVTAADVAAAAHRAGRKGGYVAVHVGAGNAVKRWMPERFAWVGRELAARLRAPVAVLAGPGEESHGEPLVRALPKASCLDLRGRLGLFELAAVIKGARLFVGNDGGPGHVAAAIGTPSVIVFSGTNEASEWMPVGTRVRVVERRVPCKPCASTTCPFDQACLRKVTVDQVLRACLETLGKG
ncbi:MAG: glycosyltransferase family 9 protein [Candidatus Coatesbacteria bacterium]